jgi:hypothetical protein
MKRMLMPLALAAAALFAAGAHAQTPAADQTPATTQSAPASTPKAAPMTKQQKKESWENGVKTDCSAEIASAGICAGKDFSTGLEKCLHENRAKLSDGCKAAVHPHHKGMKDKSKGAKTGGMEQAPAAAPQQTPAATP